MFSDVEDNYWKSGLNLKLFYELCKGDFICKWLWKGAQWNEAE